VGIEDWKLVPRDRRVEVALNLSTRNQGCSAPCKPVAKPFIDGLIDGIVSKPILQHPNHGFPPDRSSELRERRSNLCHMSILLRISAGFGFVSVMSKDELGSVNPVVRSVGVYLLDSPQHLLM
jgi:hypothetical protein